MRVSSSKAPRLCTSTAGRQLQLVGRVGSLPLIFGKGHKQPSLAAPQTQGLCSSSQSPLSSGARLLRGSRFPGFLCRASKDDGPKRGSGPWNPFGWILQLGSAVQTHTAFRVAFNLAILFLLMRIWPLGGRGSGGLIPDSPDSVVLTVPFSEFVARARTDEVQTASIDGPHITFCLRPNSPLMAKRPEGTDPSRISFYTVRPPDYALPYKMLEDNNVVFSAPIKRGNTLVTIMVYALYVGLLLSALNRLPIKMPAYKGPGRRHKSDSGDGGERPSITFADVAGVDEAKEELYELVDYLRAPERFSRLGARPPSGVLLVGPPGTGKTLLAKAVAGEAGVPFFSISASEFVELYVGMGAMRVRELFAAARREAPAIVFIDEIDAVAKGRDMRLRGVGNDEREQTLNQLLTELDGFESGGDKEQTVICIAATNRPDVLDAALLRPGRFDRRVSVERPDKTGREQILKVHLQRKGLPLSNDVSIASLASGTTGFTGADLANLVNEAALLAGRRSKNEVGREEFDAAILRAVAGIEKKRSILVGVEKEVVARHEVGHALVSTAIARLLPVAAAEVEKLSIIPRSGGALGFTYIPPKTEDRALMFDSEIRAQLAMLMGGRAAEHLTCAAVSTGAADDIRRATDLAYRAISEYGLNSSIGPINVGVLAAGGSDDGGLGLLMKDNASGVSRLVEKEVKDMLTGALTCAMDVVTSNRTLHEALTSLLTAQERLEGAELARWLEHVQVPQSLRDFVASGVLPAGPLPAAEPSPSLSALLQSDLAAALKAAGTTGSSSSSSNGVVAAVARQGSITNAVAASASGRTWDGVVAANSAPASPQFLGGMPDVEYRSSQAWRHQQRQQHQQQQWPWQPRQHAQEQ